MVGENAARIGEGASTHELLETQEQVHDQRLHKVIISHDSQLQAPRTPQQGTKEFVTNAPALFIANQSAQKIPYHHYHDARQTVDIQYRGQWHPLK